MGVFEMLTKLEIDEKPLRARKTEDENTKNLHAKEQMELKRLCEAKLESLKTNIMSKFDANEIKANIRETKVASEVEKLLKLQAETRELLSTTSPHLIQDFKKAEEKFRSTCSKVEDSINTTLSATSAQKNDVIKMFDEMNQLINI